MKGRHYSHEDKTTEGEKSIILATTVSVLHLTSANLAHIQSDSLQQITQ